MTLSMCNIDKMPPDEFCRILREQIFDFMIVPACFLFTGKNLSMYDIDKITGSSYSTSPAESVRSASQWSRLAVGPSS